MLRALLDASRPTKRLISVTYDVFALSASLYIAWALRLDALTFDIKPIDFVCLAITVSVSVIAFVRLGLYRAILRYMAQDAILSIAAGLLISAITLAASSFFLQGSIPRSVPVIYFLAAIILIGLPRLMVRNVVQIFFPMGDTKVLIYGAGNAGRMLVDSLRPNRELQPVAFLDDNKYLKDTLVKGLPVHPGDKAGELIAKHNCNRVFLALGATERTTKLRIIRKLEQFPVQIQTIPPLDELTKGDASINEIRDINIEDLLGRDPVQPDPLLMKANISGKVVMVTGAGGSIGSELCRQIIKQEPKALLLFELNEHNLYKINEEINHTRSENAPKTKVYPLLGSVQNPERLKTVMKHFQVDTVYHAAAYKHVPIVEHNMIEGIQNNVFGTLHCAKAAQASGVATFVLISTDKAVRSTNIMGASKHLAELATKMVSQSPDNRTHYSAVRFGNVLGSSGSVVPKFKKQIENGGPVTVTHPDVTRYFMTIAEAAQLVIQAGALSKGGETYVLEMGEPVKIDNLAREMIRLAGLNVSSNIKGNPGIEIAYTGLRSGEKLFEELLIVDNIVGTKHPRITEAQEEIPAPERIESLLEQLKTLCVNSSFDKIAELLANIPNVYTSKERQPRDLLSAFPSYQKNRKHLTVINN